MRAEAEGVGAERRSARREAAVGVWVGGEAAEEEETGRFARSLGSAAARRRAADIVGGGSADAGGTERKLERRCQPAESRRPGAVRQSSKWVRCLGETTRITSSSSVL